MLYTVENSMMQEVTVATGKVIGQRPEGGAGVREGSLASDLPE